MPGANPEVLQKRKLCSGGRWFDNLPPRLMAGHILRNEDIKPELGNRPGSLPWYLNRAGVNR